MSQLPTAEEAVAAMYPSFLAPYGQSLLRQLDAERDERLASLDGDASLRRMASLATSTAKADSIAIARDLGAAIIGGLRLAHQFHPDQVRALLTEILGFQHQIDALRSEVADLAAALADAEVRLDARAEFGSYSPARY